MSGFPMNRLVRGVRVWVCRFILLPSVHPSKQRPVRHMCKVNKWCNKSSICAWLYRCARYHVVFRIRCTTGFRWCLWVNLSCCYARCGSCIYGRIDMTVVYPIPTPLPLLFSSCIAILYPIVWVHTFAAGSCIAIIAAGNVTTVGLAWAISLHRPWL